MVSRLTRMNVAQSVGRLAPNSGPAVATMMPEAITAWKMVLRLGMIRMAGAGTPLIL